MVQELGGRLPDGVDSAVISTLAKPPGGRPLERENLAPLGFNMPHEEAIDNANERFEGELAAMGPLARISHQRHEKDMLGQAYSVGADGALHKAAPGGEKEAAIRERTGRLAQVEDAIADIASGAIVFSSGVNKR